MLFSFSCASISDPTRGAATANDFVGILSYVPENRQFAVGLKSTIRPSTTPTILSTDTSGASIRYSLARRDRTALSLKINIDKISGVITVDSTTDSTTDVGTTSYFVQASADGYNTQMTTLNITITMVNDNAKKLVSITEQ